MWSCAKCETEIEDKYPHCWQCGRSRQPTSQASQPTSLAQQTNQATNQKAATHQIAVPGFASYEQMANVPRNGMWMFRRGPLQRLFFFLVALIFVKVIGSQFFGAYGNYIVLVVGVVALIIILWRFFRRDPTEGVGIKLN